MSSDTPARKASLVIIGAGISGLNALVCARKYIPRDEVIIIADQNGGYGGHWRHAYCYVRLHQPYATYTAFDEKWAHEFHPDHLATRAEILAHCTDIARRAAATPLFSHRYVRHASRGTRLLITFERTDTTIPEEITVDTGRLIFAIPLIHPRKTPLTVSSTSVTSIAPADLSAHVLRERAHFVVVGSGKTAMDAVNFIHGPGYVDTSTNEETTKIPTRRVTLVTGRGIAFFKRESCYPSGGPLRRLVAGQSALWTTLQAALQWDGENSAEIVRRFVRKGTLHSPVEDPSSCTFGSVEKAEIDAVNATVSLKVRGRMADVVDIDGQPVLVMEDGRKVPIPSQSADVVVVNCTETYTNTSPLRPVVADAGRTLNIQIIVFNPSVSTVLLTHAWFLDRLEGENSFLQHIVPVVVKGIEEDKENLFCSLSLISFNNAIAARTNLPKHIFEQDQTNSMLWFPPARRLYASMMLVVNAAELKRKCKELFGDRRFPTVFNESHL